MEHDDYNLLRISDMTDLQKKIPEAVWDSDRNNVRLTNKMEQIGKIYHSVRYMTDEIKGVCEDMDKPAVNYVNIERERAFKMKSRKFMGALMLKKEIDRQLSVQSE